MGGIRVSNPRRSENEQQGRLGVDKNITINHQNDLVANSLHVEQM